MSELYKLVRESKYGNKDSMMKIINKFKPLISKYSNKLSYDGADTDLTIALIEIINKLPIHNKDKMGKEQFIVGYIHKSIINKYIYLSKKNNKILKMEIELNLDIKTPNNMDNSIDDNIVAAMLLDEVSQLQKLVLIKRFLENYTEVEIANELKISRQAVNRIKNRALKKLRQYQ
ncbi:sigma-70 family RNA polymerase sigma factor [Clostridium sporogenes]|uniref:RNA polymerase sigma factor n=1 Tax=Clostridium sporogenes TaxID=1509 RepID=UPI0013D8702F|nr:sigma-70 family RNA polymerase sigma factor [Clostridium sporogenes]NFV14395.1 sigma-70 family RNA polymerase sigma factor [Clostridium sporogenes]